MPSPVATTQVCSFRLPPRASDCFTNTCRTDRIGDSRERQLSWDKKCLCPKLLFGWYYVEPPVFPAMAACRQQEQSVSKYQRKKKKFKKSVFLFVFQKQRYLLTIVDLKEGLQCSTSCKPITHTLPAEGWGSQKRMIWRNPQHELADNLLIIWSLYTEFCCVWLCHCILLFHQMPQRTSANLFREISKQEYDGT